MSIALSPSSSAATSQSKLCSQCQKLNLSASKFFVFEGREEKNPHDIYNPIVLDTRTWDNVETATDCSLCRLVVSAVGAAQEDWQAGETPQKCQLVSRRLRGYDSQDSDDIRVLEFTAQYKWSSVSDLLVPVQSNDYPGAFPGRIIEPRQIDFKLVRQWMQKCDTEHTEACQHFKTAEFENIRPDLLGIDVQAQCLRRLPKTSKYIALSYVWGGIKQTETNKDNLHDLLDTPGALGKSCYSIPKTIRDAIELTKQLGEDYLWVDALCIVQDDDTIKKSMIGLMHVIYSNAFVTIFAASGSSSDAGLPGVSPSSRAADQLTAPVAQGLTFIYPASFTTIKRSAWSTRGWTYQEYFFSPRRLIFTAGRVIYQCNTIRWQEDLAQEHLAKNLASFQTDKSGKGLGWEPPKARFPNYPSGKWSRYHYLQYLTTYLARKLSYDSDILNAFAGIINDARDGGVVTEYGLTKHYFGLDMLWKHSTWATRRPGFPSWSWAGWKGCIVASGHGKFASEDMWLQKNSWIHWYAYKTETSDFHLLGAGSELEPQDRTLQEELRMATSEMGIDATGQGQSHAPLPQNTQEPCSLNPILARLVLNSLDKATATRQSPFPASCVPDLDNSTLLSRTMTAYVWVSCLKPNGQKPELPRADFSVLPSTPTIYLYTKSGIHIGSAWASSEDTYDEIRQYNNRLAIEIAVLSGPGAGDWRTRMEKPSTWEYMQELVKAGMNVRDVVSRYDMEMGYNKLIATIYMGMIEELGGGTNDDSTHSVPPGFWDTLFFRANLEIISSGKFPGHSSEELQRAIQSLQAVARGLSEDESTDFLQVLLIGRLGDGVNNGSGGLKERIGIGEVHEGKLAMIEGLAFRDVLLK